LEYEGWLFQVAVFSFQLLVILNILYIRPTGLCCISKECNPSFAYKIILKKEKRESDKSKGRKEKYTLYY